jgi:hypothetical protein
MRVRYALLCYRVILGAKTTPGDSNADSKNKILLANLLGNGYSPAPYRPESFLIARR